MCVGRPFTGRRHGSISQFDERRAQVRRVVVVEGGHERVMLEDVLHDAALNARAAAVHDPHTAEPFRVRRDEILIDDRRYVLRTERVKVEFVFDWDFHRPSPIAHRAFYLQLSYFCLS